MLFNIAAANHPIFAVENGSCGAVDPFDPTVF